METEELIRQAVNRMKVLTMPEHGTQAWRFYDQEGAHCEADDILCEVLEALGQTELVEAWGKVGKWYS